MEIVTAFNKRLKRLGFYISYLYLFIIYNFKVEGLY